MDHSFWGGSRHCTGVRNATLRAIVVWWERDCVSFRSLLGPYAGVVKRVAGVGRGFRSACTFFFMFITLRNRKEFSKTLAIKANVCKFEPFPRGIVVLR